MKQSLDFYKQHLSELVMCGLSKEEQETVVIRTYLDDNINVETTLPSDFTIFRKHTLHGEWELTGVEVSSGEQDPLRIVSARFKAPKKMLSFRAATKVMSDEHKARSIEALKKLHSGQQTDCEKD